MIKLELEFIYDDGTTAGIITTVSPALSIELHNYYAGGVSNWWHTEKLNTTDIRNINNVDNSLKDYLKTGCIIDVIGRQYL